MKPRLQIPAPPVTGSIQLARMVRLVLSALPKERRITEEILFDILRGEFWPGLQTFVLCGALGWNQRKGYIDCKYSQGDNRKEWFLTNDGWSKEALE